jgi:hypothetical protein
MNHLSVYVVVLSWACRASNSLAMHAATTDWQAGSSVFVGVHIVLVRRRLAVARVSRLSVVLAASSSTVDNAINERRLSTADRHVIRSSFFSCFGSVVNQRALSAL